MTFSVYAWRARGDIEVRYIGQTANAPATRLTYERSLARSHRAWFDKFSRRQNEGPFGAWLCDTDIEIVVLTTASDRDEARSKERLMCEVFARAGHRLFNRWLVPAELRRAA